MRTSLIILILFIGLKLNAQSNWTSVGPIGGDNYYSICTTPDSTYYVAAFYPGKILKSTNGGSTWTTIYTNSNALLKSIYFINNQVGFACGASSTTGALILKTTNGGTSWSPISLPNTWGVNNGSINDIVFYNNFNGFAVGHQGIYLKTTNVGTSWQDQGFPNNSHLWDIGHYNQDTIYYASADGLYRNLPNNSSRLMTSSFSAVDRGNNDIFAINNSHIYGLHGGGTSPSQLASNPLSSNSIQSLLAISDSLLFIGGSNRNIYISQDGGNTFTTDITPINNYNIIDLKYLNGIVWAVGSSGQILKRQTLVGVEERKKIANTISLYPNPVKNKLYLESKTTPKEIQIFQSNGQLINAYKVNGNTIEVENLNRGIYFIKMKINEDWVTSKFVKQ